MVWHTAIFSPFHWILMCFNGTIWNRLPLLTHSLSLSAFLFHSFIILLNTCFGFTFDSQITFLRVQWVRKGHRKSHRVRERRKSHRVREEERVIERTKKGRELSDEMLLWVWMNGSECVRDVEVNAIDCVRTTFFHLLVVIEHFLTCSIILSLSLSLSLSLCSIVFCTLCSLILL